MSSPVAKFVSCAALLALPLCASAQLHIAPIDRTGNLTLLPGPAITSPAGQHPLTPQGWIISSGTSAAGAYGAAISPAERIAELEVRAAQDKLDQAKAKLEKLRAERAQIGPGQIRLSDPLRFDSKLGPVPNPMKLEGPVKGADLEFKRN